MTYLQTSYRFRGTLSRTQMKRLGDLPGHYGIRRIHIEEKNNLAQIEYDASRLKEAEVVHWIRKAGIPLTERVDASALPEESSPPEPIGQAE